MYTRRLLALRLTVVVTAALALAGCGTPGSSGPDAEPAAAVDCAQINADSPAAGRVPSDFEPVAVYRCDQFGSMEDADGRWSAITTERLEGDLGPLLAALGEPDDANWPGPCAAIMMIAPQLWLVDLDGVAIRVALPSDGCGQPKVDPVNTALAALTIIERSSHPLQLVEMRTALEAGCPTRYTAVLPALGTGFDEGALLREENLADHGFGSPTPAPSGEPSAPGIEVRSVPIPPFATPDEVEGMLLCRYVPEHLLPTPEVAGTFAYLEGSGLFVDSRTLGREDALTVLAAADFAAAPAVPCTQEATEFVALFPLPDSGINGPPITVEVDGCQRISGFGSGFTPASAELLALVG